MRWMRWIAVVALFAIGFGAIVVSTVGLGDTQAATTGFLTQAARRMDVAKSSAATGTVASAATYALRFGEEPRIADDAASGTDGSWMVEQVLVSVGDAVTAGQLIATADTADLEGDLAVATSGLELARISETEAQDALDSMRSDLQSQLVDAKAAVTRAELSVRNARVALDDAAAGNPTRNARIGLLSAQEQLRGARRTRNDIQSQLKGDFPEQTVALGDAQSLVADLERQVADLGDQIELARITAPIDGIVAAVAIEPGFVAPSGAAVVLEDATLEVVADVVESDVPALALGQTAMVSIDALDLDVPGTVTSIAPSTEAGAASVVTFPVTVTLIEPDASVRPGMSTDVEITIAQAAGVVAVPAVALSGAEGDYSVRVVDDAGTVGVRPVQVGLVTEAWAEVQSGVAAGEIVVVGTDTARVVTDEDGADFGRGFGGFRGLQGGGGPDRPRGDD